MRPETPNEATRRIIDEMPYPSPEMLAQEKAERDAHEAKMSALPLWLRVCVECLMQTWPDYASNVGKADAMLDAAELVLKKGSQSGEYFELATNTVHQIAANKPIGWKLRVRAARLLVG